MARFRVIEFQAVRENLFTGESGRIPIRAYAVVAAPGLCVHRAIELDEYWRIAHIPSGFAISDVFYPTRDAALAAAESLAGLVDWTLPAEDLTAQPDWSSIAAEANRILADAGGPPAEAGP